MEIPARILPVVQHRSRTSETRPDQDRRVLQHEAAVETHDEGAGGQLLRLQGQEELDREGRQSDGQNIGFLRRRQQF